MSLSSLRAWFSPASIPVRRNSFRAKCPDSATRVRSRSLFPCGVGISSTSSASKPSLLSRVQPLGDPAPLVLGAQDLLAGELLPQGLVALAQLLGDLERVDVVRQPVASLQVEQFAGDPLGGQLDVVHALPVGQGRVLLAGLRVDQVRLKRARVVPEQRVGQRAVPPEEPGQVQPDEQFDQRVQQAVDGLDAPRVGEDRTVRRRVGEELGHQDRVAVLLRGQRLVQVDRDPDRLDGRDVQVGQRPQYVVLAPREPFTQFLERVQGAVVVHEPHHVPRDAPLADLDQPVVPPLGQRH